MPRIKCFNKRKSVGKPNPNSKKQKFGEFISLDRPSTSDFSESDNTNFSASKTKLSDHLQEFDKYTNNEFQFDIVNLNALNELFSKVAICKFCHTPLKIFASNRNGLSCKINIQCHHCDKIYCDNNSQKVSVGNKKLFDINIRLVYALRSIGKGQQAGVTFCAVMNLPSPPRFTTYNKILCDAARNVCNNSLKDAVEHEVLENDGCTDIAAAFDGSWQRRGYRSLNGVVSAISLSSGKVIDLCVFSKYCRCKSRLQNIHNNSCSANYEGVSGGMEVSGVLEMFRRSQALHNVRYKYYLGDGDSKGYESVVAAKPYGSEFEIKKLECVGHVKKRMGARLRKLKTTSKKKLDDNKTLGGRGRLTFTAIDEIQTFYGLAIQRNVHSLTAMKTAIWAEYFHLGSTNDKPCHQLCPKGEDTWCKFWKAKAANPPEIYDHNKHTHLPPIIMTAIKPIFKDLANPLLLEKCLHGTTQNRSESLNNVIWSRLPKRVFVARNTLEFGVYDAVSTYNKGNITKCLVLESIGLQPGHHCITALKKIDEARIKKAEKAILEIEKKSRFRARQVRNKLEDQYLEAEDPDNPAYGAGMH